MDTFNEHPEKFQCWAVVDLMGHSKTAGLISEQSIAGKGMIRIDIPDKSGEIRVTRFYSPDAVYSLAPVDKQIAVAYAAHHDTRPVQIYDLRKLIEDKKVGEGDNDGEYYDR